LPSGIRGLEIFMIWCRQMIRRRSFAMSFCGSIFLVMGEQGALNKRKARKIRAFEYPLGESNPCPLAENQISWATRRRGLRIHSARSSNPTRDGAKVKKGGNDQGFHGWSRIKGRQFLIRETRVIRGSVRLICEAAAKDGGAQGGSVSSSPVRPRPYFPASPAIFSPARFRRWRG
jgi:hypothetical protein